MVEIFFFSDIGLVHSPWPRFFPEKQISAIDLGHIAEIFRLGFYVVFWAREYCFFFIVFSEKIKFQKCVYMAAFYPKKKPKFVFCPDGLCQKCVYLAAFCPKQNPGFFPPAAGCVNNVYIWQHLAKKKKSPAAGCVKNVYIWHHFAQNRNKFVSPKILFPNWHRFQKSKEIFYSFKMCLYGINLCIWSLTK